MNAGFAKVCISPPLGTPLMGCGKAAERHCSKIHDPLFVRALFAEHDGQAVVVASFNLCFVAREVADQMQGVLCRRFGLFPSQVMLTATHTHAGPAIGSYFDLEYGCPARDYVRELEHAIVRAIAEARSNCRAVRIHTLEAHARNSEQARRPGHIHPRHVHGQRRSGLGRHP